VPARPEGPDERRSRCPFKPCKGGPFTSPRYPRAIVSRAALSGRVGASVKTAGRGCVPLGGPAAASGSSIEVREIKAVGGSPCIGVLRVVEDNTPALDFKRVLTPWAMGCRCSAPGEGALRGALKRTGELTFSALHPTKAGVTRRPLVGAARQKALAYGVSRGFTAANFKPVGAASSRVNVV
jgi:hypothetical protein